MLQRVRRTRTRALLATSLAALTFLGASFWARNSRADGIPATAAGELNVPPVKIMDTKLPNGLRVLIVADHTAPVYAIDVCYNVGSRNERPGRTGFAHLFEHMMFEGSENVGKGRAFHSGIQQRRRHERHDQRRPHHVLRRVAEQPARSGTCFWNPIACGRSPSRRTNSTTSATRCRKSGGKASTISRMGGRKLDLGQSVLRQFCLQAFDDRLDGGSERGGIDDVQDFFRIYYAPNNAVLTLVGDFDPDETLSQGEEIFRLDSRATRSAESGSRRGSRTTASAAK